jgi:transposase
MIDLKELPDDPVQLKKLIRNQASTFEKELRQKTAEFESKLQQQSEAIELLQEEKQKLLNELFGRSSEKTRPDNNPDQPNLFDEIEEIHFAFESEDSTGNEAGDDTGDEDIEYIGPYKRSRRGSKKDAGVKFDPSMPRTDIIIDIPEEEKMCACGCKMDKIGEEVTEKAAHIPAQYRVERHIRPKYACKSCEGAESEGMHPAIKIAKPAPAILPKSNATAGLLAQIITAKFEDALPLYRQEKIFARHGLELSRSTMSRWVIKVYEKLMPILEIMYDQQRSGPLIGIDETTVQVLREPGRANTSKSYMWVTRGGPPGKNIIRFYYDPGRGGQVAKKLLKDFSGAVQSDGYAGYNFLDKEPDIQHAGCWAHVRRKFHDVTKASKKAASAKNILSIIGRLYKVEKYARMNELSPEAITELRQQESKEIVDAFFKTIETKTLQVSPSSLMGKAIAYAMKIRKHLYVFLEDGNIPIDNNYIENNIRPFVVGRKNWIFSGSPNGAEASGGLYSLIETAKEADLNPYWYLRHVFERLPLTPAENYSALLPYNVSKEDLAEYFKDIVGLE